MYLDPRIDTSDRKQDATVTDLDTKATPSLRMREPEKPDDELLEPEKLWRVRLRLARKTSPATGSCLPGTRSVSSA
jgi:hypothetical protein